MMLFDAAELIALVNVLVIDVVLAVDNAVVMGAAAARLPDNERKKAVLFGSAVAAFCRIVFAIFALKLLSIPGLTLAGGLLLLWVAWKLWRDLRKDSATQAGPELQKTRSKFANSAILQIIIADISMSLDNTLAVAGAARDHFVIMVIGLALSVLLMGMAANFLAKLIHKHRWISYIGLVIVLYVALAMSWDGAIAVQKYLRP